MGVQPLNLKRKAKSNVIKVQDEDEQPVVQKGPIIRSPVSASISIVREERVAKYSDWYIKRPLPPDPDLRLPDGIVPKVHNIVATVNMGCQINLAVVAVTAVNVEYNPNRFSALVMKLRKPKVTGLFFSTGKVVITEAKSLEESKDSGEMFANILRQACHHTSAKVRDHKVHNVVATCSFKFPIRLNDLFDAFQWSPMNAEYNPERFPGVTLKLTKPAANMLVFLSGKVVITGLPAGDLRTILYLDTTKGA